MVLDFFMWHRIIVQKYKVPKKSLQSIIKKYSRNKIVMKVSAALKIVR